MNLFTFGLTIKAIDEATGVFKRIQQNVEKLNNSVRSTAHFREAGQNMAIMGAGIAAVGAAIAVPLKDAIDKSMELDAAQRHLRTALDAGAAGQRELAAASEAAEKASVALNVSQEDYLQNVYLGISAGLNYKQAIDNATASIQLAKGTQGDFAETGRVVAQLFNDFGNRSAAAAPQLQHFADVTAYAVRQFAFKNIGEFNEAVTTSIGAAKAANVPFEDLTATIAGFQKVGMTGSMAGDAIVEALQAIGRGAFSKMGIPLARFKNGSLDLIGTLVNLKQALGSGAISVEQFQRVSKALGARGNRLLALDPEQLRAMRAQLNPANVAGASAQGARIVLGGATEQLGKLHQAVTQLEELFGGPLSTAVGGFAASLTSAVTWLTAIGKAHPQMVKFIAIFLAAGAALAIVVGGAIALAGGLLAIGSFFTVGGGLIAVIGGIGIAIAAAVAVFALFHTQIAAFFTTLIPNAFNWGVDLIEAFAHGLMSVIGHPIQAVQKLAHMIRGFFPHSPAKEGPLRDLHRVKIVEQIAASIQPAPMMAAIRKVAASAAIAIPMAIGAGVSPALARNGTNASSNAGAMTINYSPTVIVNGGSSDVEEQVLSALRKHKDELMKQYDSARATRRRTEF